MNDFWPLFAITFVSALVGAAFGFHLGIRMIVVWRHRFYHHTDDLIHLIEEVAGLTPDGRIDPTVVTNTLYKMRQECRIPAHIAKYEERPEKGSE